jgi:hypothetical protein
LLVNLGAFSSTSRTLIVVQSAGHDYRLKLQLLKQEFNYAFPPTQRISLGATAVLLPAMLLCLDRFPT